ncbi:hypothetical protein RF55_23201 [Lasius niger]|uniref:Uncharacterized protein n=1 Tax=Lasius niger TaxID=67767 RepID=A0A0J7JW68_LASNI|nr:hypothetical protein RF55_23201 [Lasius niger]
MIFLGFRMVILMVSLAILAGSVLGIEARKVGTGTGTGTGTGVGTGVMIVDAGTGASKNTEGTARFFKRTPLALGLSIRSVAMK